MTTEKRCGIIDLHAHYDMHIVALDQINPVRVWKRARFGKGENELTTHFSVDLALSKTESKEYSRHRRARGHRALAHWVFHWINKFVNDRSLTSGPAVTVRLMKQGHVGVVLAPIYDPFDEFGTIPWWLLTAGGLALIAATMWLIALVSLCSCFSSRHPHSLFLSLLGLGLVALAISILLGLVRRIRRAVDPAFATDELPGSPPRWYYIRDLLHHIREVEKDIDTYPDAVVVRDFQGLESAINDEKIALIHAVEGGFQLGSTRDAIAKNVAILAARGVAYVTLAHLFYRGIATNAAAFPVKDRRYHQFFPQPNVGLTDLGQAAVEAMFLNGILIDLTHMSRQAMEETFQLLERLEKRHHCIPVPVLATHIACRFNSGYEYNLADEMIRRIADRQGLMGVIFCNHWMSDGQPPNEAPSTPRSFELVERNIRRIERVTGSRYRCLAIGSDLDGFIKPPLYGLEDMSRMANLENQLREVYSAEIADRILHENALRVLESAWRKTPEQRRRTS